MITRVTTLTFIGINTIDVDVQIHIASGIPSFTIVGLPDKTIAESKERVRASLNSLGISLPAKRITINLAPADLFKEGSHFDLPIAIAILIDMQILPKDELSNFMMLGELALDGKLVSISGILPASISANAKNMGIICPKANGTEAAWSGNLNILAAESLLNIINHFKNIQLIQAPELGSIAEKNKYPEMKDVKGQYIAKRAIEITASGGHNLLMCGPPGSGKSMLAERMVGILPPMNNDEVLEYSMIKSIAQGLEDGKLDNNRPFRSPHHSCSMAAMVGGGMGKRIMPGEISLAHNGVLFLDELPEFPRIVIDSLRQPIEKGNISIARANSHVTYPAKFQLVAAMNPCRCGYLTDKELNCNRAPKCAIDYQTKISGPLLDRIDIHIDVEAIKVNEIQNNHSGDDTATIAKRVLNVKFIQEKRYAGYGIKSNSELVGDLLNEFAFPCEQGRNILNQAAEKMKLTMRGYNRILKVARTIADMEESYRIEKHHVAEAINYRPVFVRK